MLEVTERNSPECRRMSREFFDIGDISLLLLNCSYHGIAGNLQEFLPQHRILNQMGSPSYIAISHTVWECSSKSGSQYHYLDKDQACQFSQSLRLQSVAHAHFLTHHHFINGVFTTYGALSQRPTNATQRLPASLRFNDAIVFLVNKIVLGQDARTWYYRNLFFSELQSSSFVVISVGDDKKAGCKNHLPKFPKWHTFLLWFWHLSIGQQTQHIFKEKSTAGWYSTPNILLICLLFSREIGPPGCIFAHH